MTRRTPLETWACPRCGWTIETPKAEEVWHLCTIPGRPTKNIRCNRQPKDDAA